MNQTPSIEAAQAARRFYATPKGRRERLAQLQASARRTGAEIDRLREAGEPVPFRLREQLRTLTDKARNVRAQIIRERGV